MFFVSEEFLRKYQSGEEIAQTIDEAVPVGHELFESTGGKRDYNVKRRQQTGRDAP
jgi:hypothetical protein